MKEVEVSQYVSDQCKKYKNRSKFTKFVAILLIIFYAVFAWETRMWLTVPIFMIILFCIYKLLEHYRSKESTYQNGLEGEKILSRKLREVFRGEDCIAYYGVTIKKLGDVDCLLVGEWGCFAIEAKNYKGKVRHTKNGWAREKSRPNGIQYDNLSGLNYRLLERVRRMESFFAKNKIQIKIQPILVFTDPDVELEIEEKLPFPIKACKVEELGRVINGSSWYNNINEETIKKVDDLLKRRLRKKNVIK